MSHLCSGLSGRDGEAMPSAKGEYEEGLSTEIETEKESGLRRECKNHGLLPKGWMKFPRSYILSDEARHPRY